LKSLDSKKQKKAKNSAFVFADFRQGRRLGAATIDLKTLAAAPRPGAARRLSWLKQGDLVGMIGRIAVGICAAFATACPALAELAMTGAPVAMRVAPSGKAQIVQRIPASAEIEVDRNCPRGWCRASWRHLSGYVPAEAVVLGPPPATLPGDELPPPVVYALPTYVTPPVWRWDGPYVGGNFGFGAGGW
jgi:hypothetical protein